MIGVGNPDRGDDGAGRLVARLLQARTRRARDPGLVVRECRGEAAALMEAWDGFDEVAVVDVCRGAGEAGSIHRFEADQLERLESRSGGSTHGLGVPLAIALARALGTLPRRLVVHAIEGRRFAVGEPLGTEVERAAHRLAASLALPEQQGRRASRRGAKPTR